MDLKKKLHDDVRWTTSHGRLNQAAVPRDESVLPLLRQQSAAALESGDGLSLPIQTGRSSPHRLTTSFPGRLAAVIASIAFVVSSLPLDRQPASGHAMANEPVQLPQAKTMHWKEVVFDGYVNPDDENVAELTMETWIDMQTGRNRSRILTSPLKKDGTRTNDFEYVFDGECTTVVNHATRTVYFNKTSELRARWQTREGHQQSLKALYIGDPNQLKAFTKLRTENVVGVPCDVWEGAIPRTGEAHRWLVNGWLSQETGDLLRLEVQVEGADRRTAFHGLTFELLERDVKLPDEMFRLDPPNGYTLGNTRETAPQSLFAHRGFFNHRDGVGVRLDIVFTLSDGTVIAGWNTQRLAPNGKPPESVFSNLVVGGPLPLLAFTLSRIRTIGLDEEIEYVSRHLTRTDDDDGYHEWSLHVPRKQPPARSSFFGYSLLWGPPGQEPVFPTDVRTDAVLESDEEFDVFVRGAMAELSRDGQAPPHITHQYVAGLVHKIRDEIAP